MPYFNFYKCALGGHEWIHSCPPGANGFILARWASIVFLYPIGQKKVTLGPLFRSKNDENRACVTKINLFLIYCVLRAQSGPF